jgi:hypothetical protein
MGILDIFDYEKEASGKIYEKGNEGVFQKSS